MAFFGKRKRAAATPEAPSPQVPPPASSETSGRIVWGVRFLAPFKTARKTFVPGDMVQQRDFPDLVTMAPLVINEGKKVMEIVYLDELPKPVVSVKAAPPSETKTSSPD